MVQTTTPSFVEPKFWGKIEIRKVIDGEEIVYLRRWYLIQCRWFNVFLHHILLPDLDRDLHDHPWWFASIALLGSYEERWVRPPDLAWRRHRYVRWFSFHRLGDAHRITMLKRVQAKGVWSLVLTGPSRKKWGFYTPEGWLDHENYLFSGHTT